MTGSAPLICFAIRFTESPSPPLRKRQPRTSGQAMPCKAARLAAMAAGHRQVASAPLLRPRPHEQLSCAAAALLPPVHLLALNAAAGPLRACGHR